MNCKHDFQIKQRITNRNSLLEYDIRNIVAMVREPILLIKLLEDFYISTICHSYENIGNGKFPWISRSLWKTWCFFHQGMVAYGLCQMVLVFRYMRKHVYVVSFKFVLRWKNQLSASASSTFFPLKYILGGLIKTHNYCSWLQNQIKCTLVGT
jgi:hypothetical protein